MKEKPIKTVHFRTIAVIFYIIYLLTVIDLGNQLKTK